MNRILAIMLTEKQAEMLFALVVDALETFYKEVETLEENGAKETLTFLWELQIALAEAEEVE